MKQFKFTSDSAQSGRYFVHSGRTGKIYCVEPLDSRHEDREASSWGDIDPATKTVTGSYGNKYKGSIDPSESVITESNGFTNIVELAAGTSPNGYIEMLDAKYPDKV
jgi:hypothetical protein